MKFYVILLSLILGSSLVADEVCKLHNTPFGELIRHHESRGNYNIYNKPKTYAQVKSENISNFTIAEMIKRQLVDRNIHAAGAYQMARVTDNSGVLHSVIEGCATALGISTTEKFGVEFQNRCFDEYLTTSKKWRGAIYNYFYGNGSIEAAALATAQEWASMPTKNGTSYYGNGIDKAGTTYENLIATMEKSKEQIKLNQCNPEEQPDNNATGPDNNTTTSTTQPTIKKYDIKNNTYFGECIDIDFNPEINSCGFSPASPKVVMGGNGNAFSYTHENDSSTFCYCATDMNAEAGQYGVVNSIVIPSEVKINEETTQMLIDSINTLVYLKEYWTRGLGAEAFGLGPQATLQLSNNMEQRQLSHALEEKNKDKCLILDLKINEISSRINKLEQELIKMTQRD
ncbi:hypothetical protein [Campylobacter sp. JMF_03 NE3]|uniref:hypothetical protein n=1 Tax=Campylobacter sp. JMF_03 NE3 TaxID=2983831 RepID=UPI0022E9E555|nr:hypothetical protein [Campylobacter sp. JMF_03 NE3]MDA3053685.1 hypothetical protein [Campylobacter sp. JMF_03 NE3]